MQLPIHTRLEPQLLEFLIGSPAGIRLLWPCALSAWQKYLEVSNNKDFEKKGRVTWERLVTTQTAFLSCLPQPTSIVNYWATCVNKRHYCDLRHLKAPWKNLDKTGGQRNDQHDLWSQPTRDVFFSRCGGQALWVVGGAQRIVRVVLSLPSASGNNCNHSKKAVRYVAGSAVPTTSYREPIFTKVFRNPAFFAVFTLTFDKPNKFLTCHASSGHKQKKYCLTPINYISEKSIAPKGKLPLKHETSTQRTECE